MKNSIYEVVQHKYKEFYEPHGISHRLGNAKNRDDIGKRIVEIGVVQTKLYVDMSNVFTCIENSVEMPKKGRNKKKR
ncbi:MAG: hypothetical protein QMD06_02575 [Candidatus Altarchaeum sp.]|nr:hypothetical protein [Candidatus Altarchaeum sp.]